MKQIAKLAGVSLGTVSHVLNGSATVSEPLRLRVLSIVEQLGYKPNQLARGLRRDKTNMIGMIIPDVTNPFFPAVVRGAEDAAFAQGFSLVLCNTDNDHRKEAMYINNIQTYLPSGMIIIPSDLSPLNRQPAGPLLSDTATVCVDRLPEGWTQDSVTSASEKGAHAATTYLLDLGHTRIAAIVGPSHLSSSLARVGGYKRALTDRGIAISPELIQESPFDQYGGFRKAEVLLRMIPRPTAIFAGNDLMAFGALLAIRKSGLRCPEDVSIIGFDDLDVSELTSPPLSSVAQQGYTMGSIAANMVIERVRGDKSPPKHVVLETELRIRQSVGPVRQ